MKANYLVKKKEKEEDNNEVRIQHNSVSFQNLAFYQFKTDKSISHYFVQIGMKAKYRNIISFIRKQV
jgi:hypothetical protein